MIGSKRARSCLKDYSLEDVRTIFQETNQLSDEISVKSRYLGNLCALGDIDKITTFLQETDPQERETILNHRPVEQCGGTCLHMLLYWNTGRTVDTLFALLIKNGAGYYQDAFDQFPWQMKGTRWVSPIEGVFLGERDTREFSSLYAILISLFALEPRKSKYYNIPLEVKAHWDE
jgi:hypothetical protein